MADACGVGDILEIHMGNQNDTGGFERAGEEKAKGRTKKADERGGALDEQAKAKV